MEFLGLPRSDVKLRQVNPNLSPPVSTDLRKGTETSVPSAVWLVAIGASVKLSWIELPSL